ncbi:MAG: hypothetical protein LQ348_002305 [Seirophora lacunosa]|nr:MAG: hypothetical protein LQ348_002305 [Seirophora lacunosa]
MFARAWNLNRHTRAVHPGLQKSSQGEASTRKTIPDSPRSVGIPLPLPASLYPGPRAASAPLPEDLDQTTVSASPNTQTDFFPPTTTPVSPDPRGVPSPLPACLDQTTAADTTPAGVMEGQDFTSNQFAGFDGFSGVDELFESDDSMWSGFMGSEGSMASGDWLGDIDVTGGNDAFDLSFNETASDIRSSDVLLWLEQTSAAAPSPDTQSLISTIEAAPEADPVLRLFPDDRHTPEPPLGVLAYSPALPRSQSTRQPYRGDSLPEDNGKDPSHALQPTTNLDPIRLDEGVANIANDDGSDTYDQSDSPWDGFHVQRLLPRIHGPSKRPRMRHLNIPTSNPHFPTDDDCTDDGSYLYSIPNDDYSSEPPLGLDKKRKRCAGDYRVIRSRQTPLAPSYPIVESPNIPGQSRAIDWRKLQGKRDFDVEFAMVLLRLGGVKPIHRGTCVLGPDEFRCLEPSDILLRTTRPEQLPTQHSQPMMYDYIDHTTALTLAAAWFRSDDWPHNGFAFDNFLGCHLYRSMSASHLCGQEHCLTHVMYEATETKQDRVNCVQQAKAARRRGHDITPACSVHNPPCYLQVCSPSIEGDRNSDLTTSSTLH